MGTLLFGLSVFILRLETPHHIVTHNQSTVTNLEEAKYHYAYFVNFPPKKCKGGRGWSDGTSTICNFFEEKKRVIMVQKHKVGNIRTTLDIFEATLGQPLALNFETILGPEGDYLVTIGGAYLLDWVLPLPHNQNNQSKQIRKQTQDIP